MKLQGLGFTVRTVTDAGHVIHSDDLDGFLAALDGFVATKGKMA
ncbi:hypothetical protein [Streptomyces sp. GbtcB6]|nr:hypothetical protein [Streptomyces sp. GbtcB6]